MQKNFKWWLMSGVASAICVTGMIACGGGGGNDDDNGSDDNGSDVSGSVSDGGGLRTNCGVINDGAVRNPVSTDRGIPVTLAATLDSNEVILEHDGQQILVKPQGLGSTRGFKNTASSTLYAALAAEPLYFIPAGDGCNAPLATGTGQVGQIVTASGKSFSEELIAAKYAGVIETSGACGEELLATCFQAIADSHEHHVYGPAETCDASVPSNVHYSPTDAACGGNASVTVTGDLSGYFSSQLRYPDGTDRIIESCESPNCTPLKVQQYISGSDSKVACFGAPGNSVALSDINHVSIKRESDDHEPLRYCIPNPAAPVN